MIQYITKQTARRFLLQKQLLLPPQSVTGSAGIEYIFKTLRLIQYDPLNPCGRNVDLVLQARIKGYHPNDYYQWLYTQRKGIEWYDKELCIVPIADLPLMRGKMSRYTGAQRTKIDTFCREYEDELEALLKKIETSGPICSGDIIDKRRVYLFWSEEQWGRAALEILWKKGRLIISKRINGKKYFDIPHHVYGKTYQETDTRHFSLAENHILRRIMSVGMLPQSGTGTGWLGVGAGKEIIKIITDLLGQEKLIEIIVEGVKQHFVINTKDKEMLLAVKKQQLIKKSMVFLAPLDNLLWDRKILQDIFDFNYRWEVYTPMQKRHYGYYVLPILYGDMFIGRIEPVLSKEGTLEIKGFWQEKHVIWNSELKQAYSSALERFKQYLGVPSD
ncbi:MAG TPA: crosslink repair DNA glycosylase YcaQ family protein [Candidatus Sulfotelmatobacter sp.]|jgi:uncharacterized protein YcaQ|nr:crosslink repair DNA glycosylase YcaQ family protein [Candidatus Sulfotelmatobacter sp.]